MEQKEDRKLAFAEFEVDAEKRLLLVRGEIVPLKSRTFDLLLTLIENRGRVLSKEELLRLVWANQYVESNNLTVHMAALRKALGERKDENRFIVTIPGLGYKFVAEVFEHSAVERKAFENREEDLKANHPENVSDSSFAGNAPPASISKFRQTKYLVAAWAAALLIIAVSTFFLLSRTPKTDQPSSPPNIAQVSRTPKTIRSVAVLPFVNVGADSKMEYLSDGITERLINDLSRLPNLKVIARNSVFHYKTGGELAPSDIRRIAGELGVQAILIGRVISRGTELLVGVELVDAQDNTHIWGEQYNRPFADVFVVQRELSDDISKELGAQLNEPLRNNATGPSPQPTVGRVRKNKRYTNNIKALESYMKGRALIHLRTREDLLTAVRYYEQAVKEDPDYALAYTGLAEAYGNLGERGYISPREGRRQLREAARKAVELDPELAEAHTMAGYSSMGLAPYDFPAAESELRRAIELSPSLALAHFYLGLSMFRKGALDEGLAEIQTARELDPFSTFIERQVAFYYLLKRDHARALEILKKANETGPSLTTTDEIQIYVQNGLSEEALAELEKAAQQRRNDPLLIYSRGLVYAAQGKKTEADKVIGELDKIGVSDRGQALWIAKVFAASGQKDPALNWLEQGLDAGALGAFYKDEPIWDALRGDPRFTDLLREIGIPL